MPKLLKSQVLTASGFYAHLDAAAFTHRHGDHFDAALASRLLSGVQPPILTGVFDESSSQRFSLAVAPQRLVSLGNTRIISFQTVHEGEIFADVPHYSLILQFGSESFFIAGDAVLDQKTAAAALRLNDGKRFQAVFINPLQLQLDEKHRFLSQVETERVCVIHIPFPEDDVYLYGQTARHLLAKRQETLPGLQILEPMHWLN